VQSATEKVEAVGHQPEAPPSPLMCHIWFNLFTVMLILVLKGKPTSVGKWL